MPRTRVRLGRLALSIGAACAVTIGLVVVSGPAPDVLPTAVASVTPPVPHALGRKEITCPYTASNMDDMLVHPGVPGAAHEHDYFGALGVNAMTTADTIRGHGTSCPQPADQSGYWAPSLQIGTTTYRPTAAHVYYERNTTQPVTAFPAGFHMIVGDMMIKSTDTGNPHVFFGCAGSEDNRATHIAITTCKSGSTNTFAVWLEYPNCWDGKPAPGPSMSMVYATGSKARCPADHPTLLPTLRTTLWYDLPLTQTLQAARLSSGPMGSAHGDFVNGWDPAAMATMVQCINTSNRTCP